MPPTALICTVNCIPLQNIGSLETVERTILPPEDEAEDHNEDRIESDNKNHNKSSNVDQNVLNPGEQNKLSDEVALTAGDYGNTSSPSYTPSITAPLDTIPLSVALGPHSKHMYAILHQFWPCTVTDPWPWFEGYLEFYNKMARLLTQHSSKDCIQTHQDLLDVAAQLKNPVALSGLQLSVFGRESHILHTIATIYTMVYFRNTIVPECDLGKRADIWPVQWDSQGPLSDCLHMHFGKPPVRKCDAKIDNWFTTSNLRLLPGVTIHWTDDLSQHLLISHLPDLHTAKHTIAIFPYVSFLTYSNGASAELFPDNFLRETHETLMLLFPARHKATRTWLEIISVQDEMFDPNLWRTSGWLLDMDRKFDHFHFWRDRLILLWELAEGEITTTQSLQRALQNRRNSDQWFNSWIAVVVIGLTLFFGLVQSLEGAIQVYKGYHSDPH